MVKKNNERLNKTIVRSKPLLVVPKTEIVVEMASPNQASFVSGLLSGGETPDLTIRKRTRGSIKLWQVISAAQAHQEIQRGFGFHEFETFQAHSQLPPELVRRILHLPPRTFQRRKNEGRLSSMESDRLWRLTRLFALAQELFEGDTAAAAAWLQQPAPSLGGLTPCEMAETEVGSREVENLIGRLEHGVFS